MLTGINETVGSSWIDPAYDAAGNMITGPMITGPLGTDPTTKLHFVFDAWNRMVTVKADSSGSPGSTIASYTYDGRNRRITKTIGGSTYHGYYNNNWQYLETRIDSSTSSSGQIVWDLRYIDSPLALLGGTYPLYYTNDANFNVTALIDGHTGAVSERYQYDPYGNVQFYTAAWATTMTSAANNPILYCGYTLDGESGLYLARNRYLNVATGTWEKRDLIGRKGTLVVEGALNLYQLDESNPIKFVDPFGLDAAYPGNAHWGEVKNASSHTVTIQGDWFEFTAGGVSYFPSTEDEEKWFRSTIPGITKVIPDPARTEILQPGETSVSVRQNANGKLRPDHVILDADFILAVDGGAATLYSDGNCNAPCMLDPKDAAWLKQTKGFKVPGLIPLPFGTDGVYTVADCVKGDIKGVFVFR
jgi:RHS repeat-associated protein